MRFDFLIVDVFSERPFGGNQLAVLLDARRLTPDGMQAVAREFNFAETTFVFPATDPRCSHHVRIFTPGAELSFAGHPTVGTACALVIAERCSAGDIILQEGIGPVRVSVEEGTKGYSGRLSLERSPEVSDDVPSVHELATILSVPPADVLDAFCAGLGVNFTFVQLRSRGAVDRATVDHQAWTKILSGRWGPQLYIFSGTLENDAQLYARMHAPALGIPEDPATGAAVAALVGAAANRSGASEDFNLNVAQGVAMGRPSVLAASARMDRNRVRFVEVGGGCAFVAQGQIDVPEHFVEGA